MEVRDVWGKLFPYKIGDRIEITEGNLKGMRGTVERIINTKSSRLRFENYIRIRMDKDKAMIIPFWFNKDSDLCFRRVFDEKN